MTALSLSSALSLPHPPLAQETHFPGWFSGLAERIAHALHLGPDGATNVEPLLYVWFIVLPGLVFLTWYGTRQLDRVPGGLQNVLEGIVQLLDSFVKGIVGEKHGGRYVTFIGSAFLFIVCCNLVGLIPGFQAPTSKVNQTLALALCTFFMTHAVGFRYAGPAYLKHFLGEPLWLAPIALPAHVAGEIARPVSLTLRLFGNIFGEETAIAVFVWLGFALAPYIPFQLPLMALGVFTSFVQALIFSLLSCVYIAGALPHEHHHEHEHEHEHDHGHGHEHGHEHAASHAH